MDIHCFKANKDVKVQHTEMADTNLGLLHVKMVLQTWTIIQVITTI